jgi:hypothetical protein
MIMLLENAHRQAVEKVASILDAILVEFRFDKSKVRYLEL